MSSSIPPATDPGAPAPSDRLWLRSELMGTQVITRDTGRRLGVVGEVVVDIDRREVVALGLRDNPLTRFLPGLPRWMPLESIRQVGDVILVDSADSLSEAFNPERYSKVINCQVITESGVQLGRVLGFSFDIETGELTTLVIGALGVPLLGEGVLSTWELAVGEIVSSGTDRIIVYEGAEEKLKQLGTGLLEKLGIGGGSWEQEERERFRSGMIPAENQLPAGTSTTLDQRRIQPASSRAVLPESELEYVELEERREREPLRRRLYLDEDEREQDPPRRRDPYGADPYGRRDERGESYGRRDEGDGERPEPATRWRNPEPEAGGRRRDPERYDEDRFEEGRFADSRFDDERGPGARFQERTPADREPLERYGQPEPRAWGREDREQAPPARASEPRERDGAGREQRPRFEPESRWRDRGGIEPVPTTEPFDAADRSTRPRQPLEASAPRPLRGGEASDAASAGPAGAPDSRREEAEAGRGSRPGSNHRGEREPIDVEPEVLDDPW